MRLFDIFKKKKKTEEEKEIKKKEIIKEAKGRPREFELEKKVVKKREKKRFSDQAYKVLREPHVTEKATDLAEENKYIFKVYLKANKPEIKKAIEAVYGVDVVGVKIINIPKKQRRLGRISGWKKGYKKAIVEIKEGQKIEVLPR